MSEVIEEKTEKATDTAAKNASGCNITGDPDLDAILDKAFATGNNPMGDAFKRGMKNMPPPAELDADEDENECEASESDTGMPAWGKVAIGAGIAGAIVGIGVLIGKAVKRRNSL